jgi:ubiquinone/menaquinone biosynthesis C-methylase UbiE
VSNVNLSPDASIVDVGCGTGEFAPLFRTDVLHHISIEDCRRALAEIVRVAKPNAKALIMEDTESTRLVTRTMHNLDQGAFIRSKAEWTSMMEEFFTIEYSWTFDSGVCFYSGFVLRRK